jgi:diaminopropionate ammonia-lyase
MIPHVLPTRFFLNPRADPALPYGPAERSVLSSRENDLAFREISSWAGYEPTPLLELPHLARRLGVGTLRYKDEGGRLGLGSFKALGGAYGVLRVLERELRRRGSGPVSSRDLLSGSHGDRVREITVTCASLGNHGRSVAWGASAFGCRAVIFIPAGTEPDRVSAIEELGARVIPVVGSYDDAVRTAARSAEEKKGWHVVSDTAYPGYEEIPRFILQGYTVIPREALNQMGEGRRPTHVFLQAGVGGLAAGVTAFFWEELGPRRPLVTVVEPTEADCLLESALVGHPSPSPGSLDTTMSCLACREPSTLAWRILDRGANAFVTVHDHAAEETVALLAGGLEGDPPVRSQPSGVAGLTGLIAALFEPALSEPLDLGEYSDVLIIGSEGPIRERSTNERPAEATENP